MRISDTRACSAPALRVAKQPTCQESESSVFTSWYCFLPLTFGFRLSKITLCLTHVLLFAHLLVVATVPFQLLTSEAVLLQLSTAEVVLLQLLPTAEAVLLQLLTAEAVLLQFLAFTPN